MQTFSNYGPQNQCQSLNVLQLNESIYSPMHLILDFVLSFIDILVKAFITQVMSIDNYLNETLQFYFCRATG